MKYELPEDFWQRSPDKVAKDLVLMTCTGYNGVSRPVNLGIFYKIGAWSHDISGKHEELYMETPGTLGIFSSRRGIVPVIAAHEKGKTGIITLEGIMVGTEDLGSEPQRKKRIIELFGYDEKKGHRVGKPSGLYIGPSGLNLKIISEKPKDAPENLLGYFKPEL